MTYTDYHRPVLPLLISLVAGITLGRHFSGYVSWVYPLLLFSAGFSGYCCIVKKPAVLAPLIAYTALGYLLIQNWTAAALPFDHIVHYTDAGRFQISGTITSVPLKTERRTTFVLATETLGDGKKKTAVQGNIRVSVWQGPPKIERGDHIVFNSKIRSLRNFGNPGGFDYKSFLQDQQIWATANVSADQLTKREKLSRHINASPVENARNRIAELIDRTPEKEARGVLKALVIGDRQDISPEIREAFNRSGAGHLIAISGLHIGIVASVAFFFFRRLFSQCFFLLRYAWTRKAAAVLTFFPILGYGLLAGMSPSTQRAVIMVTVFLLTFLLQKERDPLNTLAVAALILLVIHPPALVSISFQLSFGAVLFILLGLSWAEHQSILKHYRYPLIKRLFAFVMMSLLAILGTLPLVMFYFNQVSLVGLLANVFLIPLIGFLAVPAGLFSVLLFPLTTAGALWSMSFSAFVLSKALCLVRFFADLPFAALKTITPSWLEIAWYYFAAGLVLTTARPVSITGSANPDETKPNHVFSIKKTTIVFTGMVFLVIVSDIAYWAYQRYWFKDLRITAIDVGQGTASLLEFPGGYTLLLDGGGFSDNLTFDVGKRILAPFLWQKKIKTVDTLVLSHPNSDHLNGLLYIAEHFNVGQVWTNSQPVDSRSYREFVELLGANGIEAPYYEDIPRIHHINNVTLQLLYPPPGYLKKSDAWRNTNNNSLVIQVKMGSKRFLFPGDIMEKAEEELVTLAGKSLKSTVLFAPHHGSKNSSSNRFLKTVEPETVIISAGWQNRFKLPHPAVIQKYEDNGYRIFRTDLNGAIELRTDGRNLIIRPYMVLPAS